jgi:hypothetical protein
MFYNKQSRQEKFMVDKERSSVTDSGIDRGEADNFQIDSSSCIAYNGDIINVYLQ